MARRTAAARADELSERTRKPRQRLTVVEKPKGADLDAVRDFAAELPDKFLHCREFGHNWRPWGGGPHPEGGFRRVLRCVRCKGLINQELDAYGMILSAVRKYPKGYLSEDMGRIMGQGRGMLRLESMTRQFSED